MNKKLSVPKFMGMMTLAMLSVSAIVSLRNLPTTALLGTQSITFFCAAGIGFFIPVALVCAELSSGWPKEGGVYLWVEEAFGPHWGFMATWLQWMESVVWLPTVLSFVAATFAYLIYPPLQDNRGFLVSAMLIVLWSVTWINFKGIKISSFISAAGVILGTLIPGLILMLLGFSQWSSHQHLPIFSQPLIPDSDLGTLVTFTAIVLGLCGMEIPAYHIKNVQNPTKDYPKAMFVATALILFVYIMGSLAIAMVIPKQEMSLIAGPMQAFQTFFTVLNIQWAAPLLAAFTLIGCFAILNTWIIGPSKGLLSSTREGYLPRLFSKVNQHEVPTALLVLQALCGTLLTSLFVFNSSVHSAYWMINTLAAQLYLIMYFILFLAFIKLRYSKAQVKRIYKVPGGQWGAWIIGLLGAATCLLAFLVGFVRPNGIEMQYSAPFYCALLIFGIVICCLPPVIFIFQRRTKDH